MATVKNFHVVKIKNYSSDYHIVEEENTGKFLFQCDTQKQGIDWAISCGFTYEIHRERNICCVHQMKKPAHGRLSGQNTTQVGTQKFIAFLQLR